MVHIRRYPPRIFIISRVYLDQITLNDNQNWSQNARDAATWKTKLPNHAEAFLASHIQSWIPTKSKHKYPEGKAFIQGWPIFLEKLKIKEIFFTTSLKRSCFHQIIYHYHFLPTWKALLASLNYGISKFCSACGRLSGHEIWWVFERYFRCVNIQKCFVRHSNGFRHPHRYFFVIAQTREYFLLSSDVF